jgi:hypothetical protein
VTDFRAAQAAAGLAPEAFTLPEVGATQRYRFS